MSKVPRGELLYGLVITIAVFSMGWALLSQDRMVAVETATSTQHPKRWEVTQEQINWILPTFAGHCKKAVEQHAKHGLRWSAGWFGSRYFGRPESFTRWDKWQSPGGSMTIYGDEAEAKDDSGNWGRVNYSCEYNPFSATVVRVIVEPGKLPPLERVPE